MRATIKEYLPVVRFLGAVLGKHYEVVLIELKEKGSGIVAIENPEVSGRKVGDGLTDLLLKFIKDETYKYENFQSNYTCISNGKRLRGSTFFIKEGEMLVGMLCINFNTESFLSLNSQFLQFVNLQLQGILEPFIPSSIEGEGNTETVLSSVSELCEKEFSRYCEEKDLGIEQFNQDNKMEVIERLNNKGVFLIKGIVPDVANLIGVSEASVYRYLSKINKKTKKIRQIAHKVE